MTDFYTYSPAPLQSVAAGLEPEPADSKPAAAPDTEARLRAQLQAQQAAMQAQAQAAAQAAAAPTAATNAAAGSQPEEELSALERFCTDVTDEARQGMLDPLVGRDDELRRLIHILSRRTKNNPVLLGQSGVGKTAIVEGLAQRIVAGDVPAPLRNARLLELDLGAVGAGCQMPGEFEERLSIVVSEIVEATQKGPVVMFIDDIHNLCPPPPAANNGAAILKPALGRGLLRCIGASTTEKFKKTIEQDAALERRFQQVPVAEPDVDQTVSVLRGLRGKYEQHHAIKINEGSTINIVLILRCFIHRKNWRKTYVRTFHDFAPFVASLRLENRREFLRHRRPVRGIHLRRQGIVTSEAKLIQEYGVELRFDRRDGDKLLVAGFIAAIEMRTAIQEVALTFMIVVADRSHAVDPKRQISGAFRHRNIDDLSFSRISSFTVAR